jgi:hypothetical protein
MTARLGEQLRAIAEQYPAPSVPPDLYQRARRRYRKRALAGAVAAGVVLLAAVLLASFVALPTGGLVRVGDGRGVGQAVAYGIGGAPGWAALATLLAVLGYVWRHRPRPIRRRRMALSAAVGVVFVLAAPPGTALWGEPHRAPGLPDRLATPLTWTFAAHVKQSPPGPVALVFSGPATRGNLEEGRLVMVAADGERYRVLDVFSDPLEATFRAGQSVSVERFAAHLSPDGRYLLGGGRRDLITYGLLDLVTGALGREPPGLPVGWSGDGRRVVCELFGLDQTFEARAVWDPAAGRIIARIPVDNPSLHGTAALSSDGGRLAVEIGHRLRIYDVGDAATYTEAPLNGWRLGGPTAWSPDDRMLALVRPGLAAVRLVSVPVGAASTLAPVAEFSTLPPGTEPRLQGWRSDREVVVHAGRAVESFGVDRPVPERLIELPEGVTHIEIASAALTRPRYRAGPATYGPPNTFFWIALAPALVVVTVIAVSLFVQRRRRRSSSSPHSM